MEESTAERILGAGHVEGLDLTKFGKLDSLEFVQLCQAIERTFRIEISDEEMVLVENLSDLCALVDRKRAR